MLGPMISDNSLLLQDTANRLGVPCIGWTGAHKFASEYCFTVANGDVATEGVMCAQWLHAQGHDKVGLFWEAGSSGRDYADYFRDAALGLGMTIIREVKLEPNPVGLKDDLESMRARGAEGLYYGGYGYSKEYEVERLYRDAPLLLVGEGTSDILRMVVGKNLLKKYKI